MSSFTIAVIGGAFGWAIIAFTALTGLRLIKVKAKVHKALGIAVLATATIHGLGALLLYLGVF